MNWAFVKPALAGRRLWLRIKKKYDVDNGVYVILFPEDDEELNKQALLHLNDLIAYRKARGVVLITANAWVKQQARSYSKGIIDIADCTAAQTDNLLRYYEVYRFTERLLIVSLRRPYGNKAWRAIGVNGITVQDMVCICIYGIRSWSEQ